RCPDLCDEAEKCRGGLCALQQSPKRSSGGLEAGRKVRRECKRKLLETFGFSRSLLQSSDAYGRGLGRRGWYVPQIAPSPLISTWISPAWHSRFSLYVQSVALHEATVDTAGARLSIGLAISTPVRSGDRFQRLWTTRLQVGDHAA